MSVWEPRILIAAVAAFLGFVFKWILEERKVPVDLRKALARTRGAWYVKLWWLCRRRGPLNPKVRAKALWAWYNSGGGLFLSWDATQEFFNAMGLFDKGDLNEAEREQLRLHLTWLRSHLKVLVGSYTEKEKNKQLSTPSPEVPFEHLAMQRTGLNRDSRSRHRPS